MKGEIYNFVFYSDIGSGTVAGKSYFVDWGRLPESRYKVTFSFTSSTLTVATTFDGMLFIPELGCSNNTIVSSSTSNGAYYNGFIGLLRNYSTNYIEMVFLIIHHHFKDLDQTVTKYQFIFIKIHQQS